MALFERLYSQGHEEVVYFSDPTCNLKVIVAIHNTVLALLWVELGWPIKAKKRL